MFLCCGTSLGAADLSVTPVCATAARADPKDDDPLFARADDSEEESLESDLGQVGTHAFARMEGDVDKQRKQILQGQMSEAAIQKQHQRK